MPTYITKSAFQSWTWTRLALAATGWSNSWSYLPFWSGHDALSCLLWHKFRRHLSGPFRNMVAQLGFVFPLFYNQSLVLLSTDSAYSAGRAAGAGGISTQCFFADKPGRYGCWHVSRQSIPHTPACRVECPPACAYHDQTPESLSTAFWIGPMKC